MKKGLLFCGVITAITLLCCYALVTADVVQKKTGGNAVTSQSATPLQLPISSEPIRAAKTVEPEKAASESAAALSFETEIVRPVVAPATASVPPAALTVAKAPVSTKAKNAKMRRVEELFQRIQEIKAQGGYDAVLWEEYHRLTAVEKPSGGHFDEGGEDCASAVPVNEPLPYNDGGDTSDNLDDYFLGVWGDGCPFDDAAPEVVYIFRPTANVVVTIDLSGSDYDTKMWVYQGTCDAVNVVACDDDGGDGLDSKISNLALTAGSDYFIIIDGYDDNSGVYTMLISTPGPCIPDFTVALNCSTGYRNVANTCGAVNDCDTRGSEDHIYEIVIPEERQYSFTLCNTSGGPAAWDSYIYLDNQCCSSGHVTSDDDGCGTIFGLSDIDCIYLSPGTYYLLIEGFGVTDCGEYLLEIDCCVPCSVDCPASAIAEGEPDCEENYDDQYNGGCNTEPTPIFQSISCGDTICGRSGTYLFDGSNYREMDWYELVVTERDSIILGAVAEFDLRLWIVDGNQGCDNSTAIITAAANDCDTLRVSACVNPGIYWLLVAPDAFEGFPCGVEYLAWLDCTPCLSVPPACPENTTFGQVVHLPEEAWTAGVSDLRTGSGNDPLIRYDSFSGVTSPTCEIHFWGLSLMNPWAECDEDPMTFEIKFYQDAAGVPGAEMCFNTVTVARQGTGLTYLDFPLYYYSAILDPCCYIADGWVSIQGTSVGSPTDCWFLWMSSGMGDGMSLMWDGSVMLEEAFDLSMCLVGTGDLIGACCIPETGDCQDGVAAADCQGIFYGDMTCAELEIPCGLGACCNDFTAECDLTLYENCQAPGLTWHPGIGCDPNPCEPVCPYPDRDIEPDNSACPPMSPACYVICEDTLCGEIQVSGDEDYYEFVIAPGETYQLFLDVFADDTPGYWTYGTGLDPQVRVYDANCVEIFYNDDGGEGLDSYLETDVLSAGTYYVHVKGFSSSTGPYILSVYCVPGATDCDDWVLCCEPGETEPNDICPDPVDPHTIACEDTICGKVCPDVEHDIYPIVVPPQTIMSLAIYDGYDCSQRPTTCIANDLLNDDCSVAGSGNTAGWQLTNELTEPWYLYLDVYQTSPGCWAKYKIVTQCCQITDYCEDPIIVPNVYHYENTISTCCGTNPVPIVWSDYDCSGSDYTSGPDVVYQISIGEPGVLDIIASGTGDNQVMVFTDCADPTNTCMGSADNTFTGDDEEILGLSLPAGTYFISKSVFSTSCGEMTIVIESDVLLTVESPTEALVPTEYALHQNYPNPFNPTTTIRYDVRETGLVSLKVFDLLGRETATLVSEKLMPGSYTVAWDASSFPSGVYFCRMEAKEFTQIRKLLLVK